MTKKDYMKFDTMEEYIGFLAGATFTLHQRMVNLKITLEMLRGICGEPLLDLILEYLKNTEEKMLEIQLAANDLSKWQIEDTNNKGGADDN